MTYPTFGTLKRQIEIEDCGEEIMLAEEGIKDTKTDLNSSPNNEQLKETLSYYEEELSYQEGRYEELTKEVV